jgi:hypothetical protein
MKIRIIAACILALSITPFNAQAIEQIQSAFGFELGSLFIPSGMAIGQGKDVNDPIYFFKPEKPYPAFRHYFVKITPESNLIYEIGATSDTGTLKRSCIDEAEQLSMLIGKKYGQMVKNELMSASYYLYAGDKKIDIDCSFWGSDLEITYLDKSLEQLAKQERNEVTVESGGADGL